jgi:squalene cyclase
VTPDAPAARGDRDLKLPSHADVDRMVSAVEKVWRRLVEMLMSLQKDKKT